MLYKMHVLLVDAENVPEELNDLRSSEVSAANVKAIEDIVDAYVLRKRLDWTYASDLMTA